jgi:hypothetical protein
MEQNPLVIGQFQGDLEVQEEMPHLSLHKEPSGVLMEIPQKEYPRMRTPSITA